MPDDTSSVPTILGILVAQRAAKYQIPAKLVGAIVQTESSGNTWAQRFEPAFLERYVPTAPERFGACSRDTERTQRATSFGLMQIMGQVARELGCTLPFLTQLCEPEIGLDYGCRQLARLRDRHLAKFGWEGVVAAYNAGSPRRDAQGIWENQVYVDKVRAAGGFDGL
jgi:soluble lytic murein transglycosylase-like protein